MPAETRNYVPKLLAVKNLIGNPARYGITLAHVPNEPYFETVTIRRHIDITLAARMAGMTLEEFRFLNPAHNKPVINSDSAETIVLPRNRVAQFSASLAQYADRPLVSTKTHVVRAGERPEAIAGLYGITLAELNNLNGIGPRRRIVTGQTLTVPNLDDLQPVLADLPVAATVFAAASRPVYTRQNVSRQVVVVRNGRRQTITVQAPVQRIANRMPVRQAQTFKPAPQRKVVQAAAQRPAVKIHNR
jgi:LysM repeat protein